MPEGVVSHNRRTNYADILTLGRNSRFLQNYSAFRNYKSNVNPNAGFISEKKILGEKEKC